MFVHLRQTAATIALGALLAGSAHAEPQAVKGRIGSLQTTRVFQDEVAGAETRELEGGALLVLAPGAKIETLRPTRLWLSGGKKTPTHVFRVTEGRVDVTIPPEQKHRVAVLLLGPRGNAGVVNQGRSIMVAREDAVSFAALEAPMLAGRGSTWKQVRAGDSRVFDLKRGSVEDATAPSAPGVDVLEPLRMALPGQGFSTEVKLTPVKDAERYQVALLRSNGNELETVSQVESTTPSVTLSGSEPGVYAVVARALDRFGVPGKVSRPDSLRVIGVDLPQGSRAIRDTVHLPPNRRVGLVAVEGLQMTYGTGAHFVPAPNSVAMSRGAVTRVRFREPKSKKEVSLNLVPHLVQAQVRMGPKTARWPKDRVAITVKLVDALGQPVADDGISTHVTVNLNPVAVEFKRAGNTLRGYVDPPKNVPGPWVVRVDVTREGAGNIGHDFLEVVESQAKAPPKKGKHPATGK